jgi:ABC-2 type transport system permease protein
VSPIWATLRAAIAEARANRSAFWTQVLAMVVNDAVWIVFWFIFFGRVGTLKGWTRSDVLLLLAVLTTGAGFVLGVLSNSRRIGQLISDGGIDAALALPVRTLPYLLVRRVDAINFGDCLFGLGLFCFACSPSPERAGIYLLGSVAGAVVLSGFLVLVGSLAFFTKRSEAGDLGFQAIILLASYPVDVFSGATKVILYTAVPAAFVSAVPAELVNRFTWEKGLGLVSAAVVFAGAAIGAFGLGLRRYTSSALWTRA